MKYCQLGPFNAVSKLGFGKKKLILNQSLVINDIKLFN